MLVFILVYFQLHIVEGDKRSASDHVSIYPKEATVHEGGSMSFVCRLHTCSAFLSVTVQWENIESKTFTSPDHIHTSKRTDKANNSATFQINFVNMYAEMEGSYHCAVVVSYDSNRSEPNVLHSDFVQLKVLPFLKSGDVQCNGIHPWIVHDGDIISLECEAHRRLNGIRLTWGHQSSLINISEFQHYSSHDGSLSGTLRIDESVHNTPVYCVAESAYSPGLSVNCSIGPFMVIHKDVIISQTITPNISVKLISDSIFVEQTDDMDDIVSVPANHTRHDETTIIPSNFPDANYVQAPRVRNIVGITIAAVTISIGTVLVVILSKKFVFNKKSRPNNAITNLTHYNWQCICLRRRSRSELAPCQHENI